MADFVLELLTEEIPARMQMAAAEQLRTRFAAGVAAFGLATGAVESAVTPRRLVLMVRDVAAASSGTHDERRGPRADAPEGAVAGFLKSTGLTRDQLEERDTPKGRFLYATVVTAGRPAAEVLGDLIPQIVREFDWPKSMRWGVASASTASPRWVRPLSGIVALLDDAVVPFTAAGVATGRTTFGHRFLSAGPIEIVSAASYAEQLRAAHVVLDPAERRGDHRARGGGRRRRGRADADPRCRPRRRERRADRVAGAAARAVRLRIPRGAARGRPADDADEPEILRLR